MLGKPQFAETDVSFERAFQWETLNQLPSNALRHKDSLLFGVTCLPCKKMTHSNTYMGAPPPPRKCSQEQKVRKTLCNPDRKKI